MDDGDNHDWRYCGTGSHLCKLRDAAPPPDAKANLVRVIKSERRLTSYRDGRLIKSYAIALGLSPIGQKEREGDGRTPEGMYNICLLYTSPSPRDGLLSRMPSSA